MEINHEEPEAFIERIESFIVGEVKKKQEKFKL